MDSDIKPVTSDNGLGKWRLPFALFLFVLMESCPAVAVRSTLIVTHASQFWDHHEETKWPAIQTLETLRAWSEDPIQLISLQAKTDKKEYFLSDWIDPKDIVISKEGELPTKIQFSRVFLMGGNLSDCNRLSVRDLLRNWSKDETLNSNDLEIFLVTPAMYDYVRGVAPGLEYPEEVQNASLLAQAQRRARTGIASPTFRLDWILDQFKDDTERLEYFCNRAKNSYEAGKFLPDHSILVRIGDIFKHCTSPRKYELRFDFVYPNAPKNLSLSEIIKNLAQDVGSFSR